MVTIAKFVELIRCCHRIW